MSRIEISVSPGAARSEIVGRRDDGWKVRVAAPPERRRANRALLDLLAAVLDVPRDRLAVVRGETSRRKIVEVAGLDAAEVERRLSARASHDSG